jgi:hypothetical protein
MLKKITLLLLVACIGLGCTSNKPKKLKKHKPIPCPIKDC